MFFKSQLNKQIRFSKEMMKKVKICDISLIFDLCIEDSSIKGQLKLNGAIRACSMKF